MGHIRQAIEKVLKPRRLKDQHTRALMPIEFVTPLAHIDPIMREQEAAYDAWWSKTAMGKKREKV